MVICGSSMWSLMVFFMCFHCISSDQLVNHFIFFQCPCFYMLSKKSLPLLDAFIEEKRVNLVSSCDMSSVLIMCFNVTGVQLFTGGSYWRERCSRELCVLAHSQVMTALWWRNLRKMWSCFICWCVSQPLVFVFNSSGIQFTFIRFLGVSMSGTCRPTSNVTFISEKNFRMTSLTWCRWNKSTIFNVPGLKKKKVSNMNTINKNQCEILGNCKNV